MRRAVATGILLSFGELGVVSRCPFGAEAAPLIKGRPIMAQKNRRRIAAIAAAVALGIVAIPSPASAADFEFTLPAGQACAFELKVNGTGGSLIDREFTNPKTGAVRTLSAGRGSDLTFTNVSTGATFSLKGNGSVFSTTVDVDGAATIRGTGHNVIIMFPTDHPAGPSTTLYVGRVAFESDDQSNFTILSSSGRTTDICAEVS
ncbi:hypothetical protein ACFVSU_05105 [Microbacterium sp. NPDC058062]|uniref:hypothetical protein n=1 Tax=Microbacterium sp. NPDC058062 TaxID=3346320 RepID=UPI0036DAB5B7